jgi:hypothetical protein
MDLALRGVENFFGETPLDQVRLFSIDDETYLKQFIKIFDKKTLTERDWIRKFLLAQYPKTYEILMALGLNVDLLATAPRIDSKVKVNAVIQNARFQYIRGFVLNGPKNPFLTGTGVQAIADFHSQIKRDLQAQNYQYNQAQRALEGKKPTAFKPIDYKFAAIPLKLVELVDPSLVWYLKNFDKLPVYGGAEEVSQTSVMRAYLKLVDDFNGEASKRAKGTEFLDRYGRYLVGLNWPSDDDKSQATVLDLWKEQAKTTTIATISSVSLKDIGSHLLSINTELFQRASSIIGSGKKPVVFIDLDDTLYPMKNRIFGILKKYDIDHNTSYFQNLTVTDVKDGKAHDSVSEFLSSQGNSVEEVLRVRESLFFYFTNQYFSYEALQIDQPFPAIKQLIERLQSKGVEIVFLTARKEFLRRSTEARLNSLGISYSALLMNNAPEDQFYRANLDKPKQAAAYISDNTALEPLAFLDNDRGVVKALGLNFPSAMTLQAAQPKTKGSWSPTVVLLKDPFDLYSLKTQSCSRHLKSK